MRTASAGVEGASDAATEGAGAADVAGDAELAGPEHATAMRAIAASRIGLVAILRRASIPRRVFDTVSSSISRRAASDSHGSWRPAAT